MLKKGKQVFHFNLHFSIYNEKKEAKKTVYNRDNLEFWFLKEDENDYFNEVEALSLQMIELVSTLIINPNLYMIIKFGIFPLVNTICHFLLMTKEQVFFNFI